jgi:hypothetical protein
VAGSGGGFHFDVLLLEGIDESALGRRGIGVAFQGHDQRAQIRVVGLFEAPSRPGGRRSLSRNRPPGRARSVRHGGRIVAHGAFGFGLEGQGTHRHMARVAPVGVGIVPSDPGVLGKDLHNAAQVEGEKIGLQGLSPPPQAVKNRRANRLGPS